MKIFTSVFGVGSATAKDWYSRGFRNLEDVIKSSHIRISNDLRLSIGLYLTSIAYIRVQSVLAIF